MDKYLYLAMEGAAQAMLAQQNNANNLANVSTIGYKRDRSLCDRLSLAPMLV